MLILIRVGAAKTNNFLLEPKLKLKHICVALFMTRTKRIRSEKRRATTFDYLLACLSQDGSLVSKFTQKLASSFAPLLSSPLGGSKAIFSFLLLLLLPFPFPFSILNSTSTFASIELFELKFNFTSFWAASERVSASAAC